MEVDVGSVADSGERTAGVEHAALEALEALGMPGLLKLGFNCCQHCVALGNIVGRPIVVLGSERATNAWLRRTSAPDRV